MILEAYYPFQQGITQRLGFTKPERKRNASASALYKTTNQASWRSTDYCVITAPVTRPKRQRIAIQRAIAPNPKIFQLPEIRHRHAVTDAEWRLLLRHACETRHAAWLGSSGLTGGKIPNYALPRMIVYLESIQRHLLRVISFVWQLSIRITTSCSSTIHISFHFRAVAKIQIFWPFSGIRHKRWGGGHRRNFITLYKRTRAFCEQNLGIYALAHIRYTSYSLTNI